MFAQAKYPVTDTLRITAGGRYDTSKVAASTIFQLGAFIVGPGPLPPPIVLSGAAGKREFNNFTYKLRVEKDLSPRNFIYGSVSSGFSPGDVVVSSGCPASISATPPCPLELEAETLTSFEFGSKNRFLGGALQLNGAVFYSKYAAFQSASINVNPNPGPPQFAPLASRRRRLDRAASFRASAAIAFCCRPPQMAVATFLVCERYTSRMDCQAIVLDAKPQVSNAVTPSAERESALQAGNEQLRPENRILKEERDIL